MKYSSQNMFEAIAIADVAGSDTVDSEAGQELRKMQQELDHAKKRQDSWNREQLRM